MKVEQWKPNVTVAALVERNGKFLMVEEETPEGVRLNQPAGHLEAGESLIAACERETREETGVVFKPEFLVGVYQWARPQGDMTYLRFAFGGRAGDAIEGAQLDAGIVRAIWMTADEIAACRDRHRSPLVWTCLEDALRGECHSLSLISHFSADGTRG